MCTPAGNYGSVPASYRFVGGRRRYNRMRREVADERRWKISEYLKGVDFNVLFFGKGLAGSLAASLGVHRTTVWRDLKAILGLSPRYINYTSNDEVLYTTVQAYPYGRILEVLDPDGYLIKGKERRDILKKVRRGRRR